MNNSLMFFRFDLRTKDNEALFKASLHEKCLPIFILDHDYIKLETTSNFHINFLKQSLFELSHQLKEFNAKLNYFEGDTLEILSYLIKKYKIRFVYSNKIFKDNFFLKLDFKVLNLFHSMQVKWTQTNQFGIQINHRKRETWSKDWKEFSTSRLADNPMKTVYINTENILTCLNHKNHMRTQIGGQSQAEYLLESFLNSRHNGYSRKMSSPLSAENSCSRLSPHLSFGTISIKYILNQINESRRRFSLLDSVSINSFKKRLAWHCHFIQKLYDDPKIEYENLHPSYNGIRDSSFNENYFKSWKEGLTGFPFLDACMRFLNEKGWLNFRMRAMITSFASYQLWLDWKVTSKFLAKKFLDYEPGIHYSQIQMQSGTTGINTLRIYNVIKQSRDQDPEGIFIKKWIPELRNLPDYLIHEPWTINYLEEKDLNFKVSRDYVLPIIDNKSQTKLARDRIWDIKKTSEAKKISNEIVKKHASFKRK